MKQRQICSLVGALLVEIVLKISSTVERTRSENLLELIVLSNVLIITASHRKNNYQKPESRNYIKENKT
jgi:hypothetical protein